MIDRGLIMQLLSIKIANDIGDHIMNRFYEYAAKYNIDLDYVTLYIYPYNYNGVPDYARCSNGEALTNLTMLYDNDNIVRAIGGEIYIPNEKIIMSLIDFNIDVDNCKKYYDIILLHEIGHIIYSNKIFVGNSVNFCEECLENDRLKEHTVPKLRKNASLKSRIKFFRTFFELEAEKGANDAVGITIDDIIDLEKLKLYK